MLEKLWGAKLTRFLTIGVFNTLFDLTILYTLTFAFHMPSVIANLFSASISMTSSYFLNHHVVFRSEEQHSFKRFAHFFAVTGIGILAIQSAVILGVTHLLTPHKEQIAHLLKSLHLARFSVKAIDLLIAKVCAVLVALCWNFLMYHYVVFKKPSESPDEDILA